MANDNTENVQYDKKKENTNPAFQVLCLFVYHCASENGLLLPNCIPLNILSKGEQPPLTSDAAFLWQGC